MNVSEPFIRRPVATSLLAGGLLILGIVAYEFLPVAPLPRTDSPTISVSASLPGADPATMASSVAAPLEKRLGQISGVNEITSVSTLGGASVTLQFDLNRQIDGAARDVQAAINASASDLPLDLPSPPTYRKFNPADAPILTMAMTSDTLSLARVYEYANDIVAQKLSQVEGVSQALVSGAAKSAVRVQINPAALASTGMSLEDVRSMLSQVNVDLPKGNLDGKNISYAIHNNDQLTNADVYQDLLLNTPAGSSIQLNSLGKVIEGTENARQAGWASTNLAVLLIIFKQSDANVIETVDRIKATLPLIKSWIPPSVDLVILGDRTTTIRTSVNDVQTSLIISICLVVMVIFLFLRRFWPTFIACITVPLALTGTFGAMYLAKYSLDNLSLMAITISVGFVVDDAIVVIENVFRYIEHGDKPFEAALKGARQIGFTVISMSTSLVAVFIPLLFMGGLIGRLFHEFAMTLSFAVLISGVISLTLTPMLCSRFLKPESGYGPPGFFYRVSESVFNWVLDHYGKSLRWVLRHQHFMLLVAFLTFIATIALYMTAQMGYFPQQDTGFMTGTTDGPQDISFEAMAKLHNQVAQMILDDPAVETLGSFVGGGYGSSAVNNGRLFITLKPKGERKDSADAIIARLRKKTGSLPGIRLFLQANQDLRVGGRSSKGQYQYTLSSANLDDLNQWSDRLLTKLRSIRKLVDVNTDQQSGGIQANVNIDRDAAARLGVSPSDIDNTLYDAFGQRQVSVIYEQYSQHHIVLEVDPKFQLNPDALSKIYVKATNGASAAVPLSAIAKFRPSNAFLSVNHQGQFPSVTLSFNLPVGVSLGEATDLVDKTTEEMHMPASIQATWGGTAQVFQASKATLPILAIAAIIAIYIVLGMLYESLIHPITILSTLPSAGVGALLALMVFGMDLDLISFIGIILLMGIVKKNAIMMVDFAIETERNDNRSPEDAIYQACLVRFRPIMMTTMAALFGTLPLAIGLGTGSELRRPLGIAVVGGLIFSQVLTLYTTPVIYLMFEHLRVWLAKLRGQPATMPGSHAAPEPPKLPA